MKSRKALARTGKRDKKATLGMIALESVLPILDTLAVQYHGIGHLKGDGMSPTAK